MEQSSTAETESAARKVHYLKDKWFVSYIVSSKDKNNYEQEITELDYISSVEETFATLNTFPNPVLLRPEINIVFARNKVEPKYESFPNGMRLCIFTKTKIQYDDTIGRVIAAVLGESVAEEVCEGNSVIDVVRISHRPGQVYKEAVRVELWMHDCPYGKSLESYFTKLLSTIPGPTLVLQNMS